MRPDWNWLQDVTRLITNGSALVLLYLFAQSLPCMVVPAAAIYWLINIAFHLWVCAQFLRYAGRRRAEQFC